MPTPFKEREAWKLELRVELPALLASHRQELAAGTADQVRLEFLAWHIRRIEKRTADLKARLEVRTEA